MDTATTNEKDAREDRLFALYASLVGPMTAEAIRRAGGDLEEECRLIARAREAAIYDAAGALRKFEREALEALRELDARNS